MITIFYGAKGTGKTKRIIDAANESVATQKGDVAFMTDTSRYVHDIKYQVRLTNVKECNIATEDGLIGFILGMLEANYDLKCVYIDGAARMMCKAVSEMGSFFERLDAIAAKSDVQFVLTVSAAEEELPDFIKKYI